MLLRVLRGGQSLDIRLSTLLDDPKSDVRAYPGDRLTLLVVPRSFSVLGAAGRIEQIPFTKATVTLAQAIATAGGPSSNMGDPAAIFVFRYVEDDKGDLKPVVYHINMMKSDSYFLAQRFQMRDNDILYFGNAGANQPNKLIQLVSQLFGPLVGVATAAAVISTQ